MELYLVCATTELCEVKPPIMICDWDTLQKHFPCPSKEELFADGWWHTIPCIDLLIMGDRDYLEDDTLCEWLNGNLDGKIGPPGYEDNPYYMNNDHLSDDDIQTWEALFNNGVLTCIHVIKVKINSVIKSYEDAFPAIKH